MYIQEDTGTRSDALSGENFFAAIQCREIPDPECQVPRPRPQCREPEPNAEYYEDSSMPRSKASGIAGIVYIYIQQDFSVDVRFNTALGIRRKSHQTRTRPETVYAHTTRHQALRMVVKHG